MKRLLLLPGYTETASIFDPLRPLLPPGLQVVPVALDAALAGWRPRGPVNAATVAQRLVEYYQMTARDVLLGHSMGGWLAIHAKQLTGCTALLLSSFTNQGRIVSATRALGRLRLLAYSGLLQSRWMSARFKQRYRPVESRQLYHQLVDGTGSLRRGHLYQQLQVLFAPAPPLTVAPDLRLHARADNIIRAPEQEAYVELPGDHFAHYFYPELVAAAIRPFLG